MPLAEAATLTETDAGLSAGGTLSIADVDTLDKVAPSVLWELGAEVISIGVSPNGFNINDDVGSTAPGALQEKVREARADIGIALDGDADRVVIIDEKGRIVDGAGGDG